MEGNNITRCSVWKAPLHCCVEDSPTRAAALSISQQENCGESEDDRGNLSKTGSCAIVRGRQAWQVFGRQIQNGLTG